MYSDARVPNWPRRHLTPLPSIASPGLCQNKGEHFEAGNLSAPISLLLLVCVDGATTLTLYGSWALVLMAARCLWGGWVCIFIFFHCWIANGKYRGDGEVQHWVLSCGVYGPPLPLPHYLHLVTHCQSDKGSHLVPSICAFQRNRDQTVQCKATNTLANILFANGPCNALTSW